MIVFRTTDVDVPFFWESDRQPAGRWHGAGEGPVQYTATTPDAAWAEFLRHQGIDDQADLAGIERAIWAIEIDDDEPTAAPTLSLSTLTGGRATYLACQRAARRLRKRGATRLRAISAAALPGTPSGWLTAGGLAPGPPRDEDTIVLIGARPHLVGWISADHGAPTEELLARVRWL